MKRSLHKCVLALGSFVATSATVGCDLVVEGGKVLTLADQGLILGSFPGEGEFEASPAATVEAGSTLVCEIRAFRVATRS